MCQVQLGCRQKGDSSIKHENEAHQAFLNISAGSGVDINVAVN